jgi:hypothetical protein
MDLATCNPVQLAAMQRCQLLGTCLLACTSDLLHRVIQRVYAFVRGVQDCLQCTTASRDEAISSTVMLKMPEALYSYSATH